MEQSTTRTPVKSVTYARTLLCELIRTPPLSLQLHELIYSNNANSPSWPKLLEKTEWLLHMHRILEGARRMASVLEYRGRCVLLHCSDGWDRTAQLSSLLMLMLDPFYRTIDGFQVSSSRRCTRCVYLHEDMFEVISDSNLDVIFRRCSTLVAVS